MILSELLTNLSLSELSNLDMGESGSGEIEDRHKPKVIYQINNGLLDIYTRFNLKENTLLIEQQEGRTTYPLQSKFAFSQWDGTSRPHPFIQDLGQPFTDDVIKIMTVYDALGRDLHINDQNDRDSVYTPQPKILQIPRSIPGVLLSVGYQAKHPPLTLDELDVELELPEVLNSALTAFVGWKVYASMNTQEAQAIAQGHQATYENECESVTHDDTVNTSISSTNVIFHQRGWR